MKKKYCGMCFHHKYADADGDGWCEQWEESDVNVNDEACCEFKDKEDEYGQLGNDMCIESTDG